MQCISKFRSIGIDVRISTSKSQDGNAITRHLRYEKLVKLLRTAQLFPSARRKTHDISCTIHVGPEETHPMSNSKVKVITVRSWHIAHGIL